MKVKMHLPSAGKIIRDMGLSGDGRVQMFHTANVLHRIKKYMPYLSGGLYKLTVVQTDIRKPEIVTEAPQANYLFVGKVMIDPKINAAGFMTPEGWRSRKNSIKVLTSRNLKYTKTKNPLAGPRWDKALKSNEEAAMVADLQNFIDRGRKR